MTNTLLFCDRGRFAVHRYVSYTMRKLGGDDVRKFEPKTWLKFKDLDKSIQELRAIYKVHPEWFEAPKPKSTEGKNAVDYSI